MRGIKLNMERNLFRREFLKRYGNEFVLRVRDVDDDDEIAYYNGNKAFNIKYSGMEVEIIPPTDVYKYNTRTTIPLENLKSLNKELSKFFEFEFNKISFSKTKGFANNVSKYGEKAVMDELYKSFETFKEKLNNLNNGKYKNSHNLDNIKEILELYKKGEPINIYLSIRDTYILDIQKMVVDEIKKPNGKESQILSSPNFGVSINVRKELESFKSIDEPLFDEFITAIKNGINKYKGKEENEKKYQHMFMLKGTNCDVYEDNVYVFEQEYGIVNKGRKLKSIGRSGKQKEGRIDCIFYSVKNKKLTNIYLIELKVDSKVIYEPNGIITHIDDICDFVNNGTEKRSIEKLEERIKYRHSVLQQEELEIDGTEKISFYTIVGRMEETLDSLKEKVLNVVDPIKYEENISQIFNNDKDSISYFKNKSVDKLISSNKNIIFKFYMDEEKFIIDEDNPSETNNHKLNLEPISYKK